MTNNTEYTICFGVYLDGHYAENRLAYAGGTRVMKGVQISEDTAKAFAFRVLDVAGTFLLCYYARTRVHA